MYFDVIDRVDKTEQNLSHLSKHSSNIDTRPDLRSILVNINQKWVYQNKSCHILNISTCITIYNYNDYNDNIHSSINKVFRADMIYMIYEFYDYNQVYFRCKYIFTFLISISIFLICHNN